MKSRKGRFIRMWILGILGVGLALGSIISWKVGTWLTAPDLKRLGDPPEDLNATPVSFASESGARIAAWHCKSEASPAVVVIAHGIRANRADMVERARMFLAKGYSVLLIDLQAHGESEADHITIGYLEKFDVRAAVDYAKAEHPGEKVAVVGVSLGGAAALLASPLEIDALILECVFPTIRAAITNRVANHLGPLHPIPTEILIHQLKFRLGIHEEDLRPIDFIPRIDCPVLVIAGAEDPLTPLSESEELVAQAHDPKHFWVVEGAGHDDFQSHDPKGYRDEVIRFLNECFGAPKQGTGGRADEGRLHSLNE